MTADRCIRCGKRVPWLSFWGNLTLTVYKIGIGVLGGSSALVADGLHSLTDVIGTSTVLYSRRIVDSPADAQHPYGHGKAEFLSSTFIYTVLLFISLGIFGGGLMIIINGEAPVPTFVTLLAAVISVYYNVLMYMLGKCAGRANCSPALLANAFENRADAVSSVATIIGIAGALLVHPVCDPIAAMVVGVVIFANCIVQLRESLSGLMDRALPQEVVQRVTTLTLAQPGVQGVDFVRSRQTGNHYWIDLGILVAPDLDVMESESIVRAVRTALLSRTDRFEQVEVFLKSQQPAVQEAGRP